MVVEQEDIVAVAVAVAVAGPELATAADVAGVNVAAEACLS